MITADPAPYLARIGLSTPARADLPALREIVAAHLRALPFENLNPFTGRLVPLDPASVDAKMVRGGRGGYCFEQNALLRRNLDALGYRTTGLSARVTMGSAPDAPRPPRSHMLVHVDLPEGPHVVDVGFGGQVLTGVLALEPDVEQATPHEPYRLRHDDGIWTEEALVAGTWRELYRFDLTPSEPADYEVANYWVSTHPTSHFVTGLIAARVDDGRRYALGGRSLAIHHVDGPSEHRELDSVRGLRDVLEGELRIDTSALDGLDDALARLF